MISLPVATSSYDSQRVGSGSGQVLGQILGLNQKPKPDLIVPRFSGSTQPTSNSNFGSG